MPECHPLMFSIFNRYRVLMIIALSNGTVWAYWQHQQDSVIRSGILIITQLNMDQSWVSVLMLTFPHDCDWDVIYYFTQFVIHFLLSVQVSIDTQIISIHAIRGIYNSTSLLAKFGFSSALFLESSCWFTPSFMIAFEDFAVHNHCNFQYVTPFYQSQSQFFAQLVSLQWG